MGTRISSRGGRSAREFLNYLPTILGLIVALSWPFWISPLLDLLFPTIAENPYLSHAGSWLAAGILLSIVLVWERQPLSSPDAFSQ
jgi:hypothetical protein